MTYQWKHNSLCHLWRCAIIKQIAGTVSMCFSRNDTLTAWANQMKILCITVVWKYQNTQRISTLLRQVYCHLKLLGLIIYAHLFYFAYKIDKAVICSSISANDDSKSCFLFCIFYKEGVMTVYWAVGHCLQGRLSHAQVRGSQLTGLWRFRLCNHWGFAFTTLTYLSLLAEEDMLFWFLNSW